MTHKHLTVTVSRLNYLSFSTITWSFIVSPSIRLTLVNLQPQTLESMTRVVRQDESVTASAASSQATFDPVVLRSPADNTHSPVVNTYSPQLAGCLPVRRDLHVTSNTYSPQLASCLPVRRDLHVTSIKYSPQLASCLTVPAGQPEYCIAQLSGGTA